MGGGPQSMRTRNRVSAPMGNGQRLTTPTCFCVSSRVPRVSAARRNR